MSQARVATKNAMGNGISIGWIGWPAMLAVERGLAMFASKCAREGNAPGRGMFRYAARARAAQRPGVTPNRAEKCRVRWLWSANPVATATSDRDIPAAIIAWARTSRRPTWKRWGEVP